MIFNPFYQIPRRPPNRPEPKAEPLNQEDQSGKNTTLSPELSFLLALTLKDGLNKNNLFDLLKNIEPYVGKDDRAAISRMLKLGDITEHFKKEADDYSAPRTYTGSRSFNGMHRQLSLLRVLRKYAGKDGNLVFDRMEKNLAMHSDISRMVNRIRNLKDINANDPEEFISTVEMFLPPEERKNISNIVKMMQLFKNMNHKNMAETLKNML